MDKLQHDIDQLQALHDSYVQLITKIKDTELNEKLANNDISALESTVLGGFRTVKVLLDAATRQRDLLAGEETAND